eukprot:2600504-Rhodomonas_salina.1
MALLWKDCTANGISLRARYAVPGTELTAVLLPGAIAGAISGLVASLGGWIGMAGRVCPSHRRTHALCNVRY